jgi:exodeoxyribonuclease V alpha subunit
MVMYLGVKNYLQMEDTGVKTINLPDIDNLVLALSRNFPVTRSFNSPRNMYEAEIDSINSLFKILTEFAILTPSKRGLYGTMSLNSRLSGIFNPRGKVFYHGQPIMITKNDYINALFNGDRGIVLGFSNGLFAFFRGDDGYKAISVSKLMDYETSYVGTVHKSQGSEFNKVAVILPKGTEKLLSREILYTALTRAKHSVDLYTEGDTVELAVNKKITRHSGIQDFLRN